ncbi:ATP-binding cassette domain-containing protein [Synechococcus sp. RSCCF101]|nr:ATP-binding cassette domain-containing protein [Synechococcus sp. RSCCF101]
MMVLFALDWSLRMWRAGELSKITGRLEAIIGVSILEKLFGLDYKQVEILGRSGLNNRLRNLDSLLAYVQGPLALACLDFPFVIIYLLAIAFIGGWLVLVPLVMMLVSAVVVLTLARLYTGAAQLQITTGSTILQTQEELANRFIEVKLANLEWVWLQRLRGLSAQSTSSGRDINRQVGQLQIIASMSAQLAGVLTLSFGAWVAFQQPSGPVALGNLIAAMFFVWRVFSPFQQLMNALLRYSSMRNQYQQLSQYFKLRTPPRVDSGTALGRFRGSIILDSAACRLGAENQLAITRVSLSVNPGSMLALTGASGSGKTTTLRVIDQVNSLASGSLFFDGIDYRQFSLEDIQRNISLLLKDPQLFPGTIWSHLTMVNPDATESMVREVCTRLGIMQIIDRLPEGIHTPLESGTVYFLPNGVRKLISFAQAVIKDAPILLIDDITRGLTPAQFQSVIAYLPDLRRCIGSGQDRSIILATDNMALLQMCDQICILDKGVTAFMGTPDELKQKMQNRPTAPSR